MISYIIAGALILNGFYLFYSCAKEKELYKRLNSTFSFLSTKPVRHKKLLLYSLGILSLLIGIIILLGSLDGTINPSGLPVGKLVFVIFFN